MSQVRANQDSFLEFVRECLFAMSEKRRRETLGDRHYIGASDIAKAKGCYRQAVLDKLVPPPKRDLPKLITFERGHWQESGLVESVRAAGYDVLHQLEIVFYSPAGHECRYHLDLVLPFVDKQIVVESKSFKEEPPGKPYLSHYTQIRLQVTALHRFWDQKAFRNAGTKDPLLSYPEYIKSVFGDSGPLEKAVQGRLFLNGGDVPKSPATYLPEDERFWAREMEYTDQFARAVSSGRMTNLDYAPGLYPLCLTCDHKTTCPKFIGMADEQWSGAVGRYAELRKTIKKLESEKKQLSIALKDAFWTRKTHFRPHEKCVSTSAGDFLVDPSVRRTINRKRLAEEMEKAGVAKDQIYRIIAAATDETDNTKIVVADSTKTIL